jgi:hypothetical protein
VVKPVLPPGLRPTTDFARTIVVVNWLVPPLVVFLAFMSFAAGISLSKRQDPEMNRDLAHFFIVAFALLALFYLASDALEWRNRRRIRQFVSSITGAQRVPSAPTLSAHTVLTVFFTLQGVCAAAVALTMRLSWYVPQEGRYNVPYFFDDPLSTVFAVGGFMALAGLLSTTAALSSLPKRPDYALP